jgi:hypothetical protein
MKKNSSSLAFHLSAVVVAATSLPALQASADTVTDKGH